MELHHRHARMRQRSPVRQDLGSRFDGQVTDRPVPSEPGVCPAAGIKHADGGLRPNPTTHAPSMCQRSTSVQDSEPSISPSTTAQYASAVRQGKPGGRSVARARYDEPDAERAY